jgi:hydroxyacylglutathione hydrolase
MNLLPLPAFEDNYVWLLHDGNGRALVVDPGDPAPVQQAMQTLGVQLQGILVTHHHADHTGGINVLHQTTGAPVYGPKTESIAGLTQPVQGGDTIQVLGVDFVVMDVPGHTLGHIAFYAPRAAGGPLLFCGDTLFSAGCGRLFEGTPAQMMQSLASLAALPDNTRLCCTHEYTLSNLKFAAAVEPDNPDLLHHTAWCMQVRQQGQPTLPSSIELENAINPFLRVRQPQVAAAAHGFDPTIDPQDALAVWAALRRWKNVFK